MTTCPCQTHKDFNQCCGPYLLEGLPAPTAETLMRSRYTAYVRCDIDYIEKTTAPESRESFDRQSSEQWAKEANWQGLEVVTVVGGGVRDEVGEVEFVASYLNHGEPVRHHERSEFRREGDRWFFVDGKVLRVPLKAAPRVGRNDPCACGSGKKSKRCCGNG